MPARVIGNGYAQSPISVDLALQTLAKTLNEELTYWHLATL